MNIDRDISQIVRHTPLLTPNDRIRRAAGLIRASGCSSLLVVGAGGVVGIVSERGIAAYIGRSEDVENALDSPIASIVEQGPPHIAASSSLKDAAEVFGQTQSDILPVVGGAGEVRGVVFRRDVLGLLTRNLRPPTVAGMATPLGVYLTTGSHSAGPGNIGLFLTGVSLMLMIVASVMIVDGLQKLFSLATGINLEAYLNSTPLTVPNVYDIPFYITMALTVVIMLLLLRISPLSGYHAAEHMTVHAIESGEELSPEVVARMPRVHPRCGTNLLAAAGIFIIITTKVGSTFSVLVALIVVVMGWRAIGGFMQRVVTTRPPNDRQLASGIKAGREIIERFQERPHLAACGFDRIWNLGFLQTASGMGAVYLALYLLGKFTGLPPVLI